MNKIPEKQQAHKRAPKLLKRRELIKQALVSSVSIPLFSSLSTRAALAQNSKEPQNQGSSSSGSPSNASSNTTTRPSPINTGGIATRIKVPADYPGPSDRYLKAITERYQNVNEIKEGLVKLTLPSLAENGNSVLLKVTVELDRTQKKLQDKDLQVTELRVFAENNPLPEIAFFQFGPESLPQIATRIRLSASQIISAVATLSDGSYWAASAYTTITLPACVEAFV